MTPAQRRYHAAQLWLAGRHHCSPQDLQNEQCGYEPLGADTQRWLLIEENCHAGGRGELLASTCTTLREVEQACEQLLYYDESQDWQPCDVIDLDTMTEYNLDVTVVATPRA